MIDKKTSNNYNFLDKFFLIKDYFRDHNPRFKTMTF